MKKLLALTVVLFSLTSLVMAMGTGEATTEAAYPKKAITMIVPYGAGGTTDLTGRQLAIQLEVIHVCTNK